MNPTVLFVAVTPYQILISYVIASCIKHEKICDLVSSCAYDQANEIAKKLSVFKEVSTISKRRTPVKGGKLRSFLGEKDLIKKAKQIFEHYTPNTVVVFKDGSPLEATFIKCAHSKNANVTLIEEGLAIYSKDIIDTESISYKSKNIIKKLLGYPPTFPGQGNNPAVQIISAFHDEMLPADKKINRTVVPFPTVSPPTNILDSFVNDLSLSASCKPGPDGIKNNNIIYLGQPLSELGIVTAEKEYNFLKKLFYLINRQGFKLTVKPHPWDHRKKYSMFRVEVYEGNHTPAEAIVHILKPDFILTPYSSAGHTSSAWFNARVMFLYPLLDINLDPEISKLLLSEKGTNTIAASWNDIEEFLKMKSISQKRDTSIDSLSFYEYSKKIT